MKRTVVRTPDSPSLSCHGLPHLDRHRSCRRRVPWRKALSFEILELRALLAPLADLPVLQSQNGVLTATLTATIGPGIIDGRPVTDLMSYNGVYSGPTLQVEPGDTMDVTLINGLAEETNLHTHGLHVSSLGDSDNVFLHLQPGEQNHYQIHIPEDHPQGLYWYHPHHHEVSNRQIFAGLSGLLVVGRADGGAPELDGLPQRLLALRDIDIRPDGSVNPIETPRSPLTAVHTINGQVNPTITMAPGATEIWNLANIGQGATYPLQLQKKGDPTEVLPLHLVAQDGQPFTEVKPATEIVAHPANRYSFIVQLPADAAPGTEYVLMTLPYNEGVILWPNGVPPGRDPTRPAGVEPTPVVLATVRIEGPPATPLALPTTLTPDGAFTDLRDEPIAASRVFRWGRIIRPGTTALYTINGQVYPDVPLVRPRLGTVEEWTHFNDTTESHPFHLHQHSFQVVSVNGISIDPEGPPVTVGQEIYYGGAWVDTVNVPANGKLVVRVKFDDFLGPFIYHCHLLFHQDAGMMGIVEAVPERPIFAAGANNGSAPEVKVFDAISGATQRDFLAYEEGFTGGVRVATGDVNADGVPDIITAPGPGREPLVKIYDGVDGRLLNSFLAFDSNFTGGVFVAAGDVTGDGADEVIVGPDVGGAPMVKAFQALDGTLARSVMAFDAGFMGGVRVAAGDVNGDGRIDVIAGAGPGDTPLVRVFSGTTDLHLIAHFLAYDASFQGGVYVGAGRVKGFAYTDIVTGPGAGGEPRVKVFREDPAAVNDGHHGAMGFEVTEQNSFLAFDPLMANGVQIATVYDAAGVGDNVVAIDAGSAPVHAHLFRYGTMNEIPLPFDFTPNPGQDHVSNGDILFTRLIDTQNGPNPELYVVRADGSGATNRSNNPAADQWAAWSPDGTKIAFSSTRVGSFQIFVMNADGTSPMRLTSGLADNYQPAWSPDGTKLAFTSLRDGNAEIYVVNADGTGERRLTSSPGNDLEPAWSPDGTRIAFTSDRGGDFDIHVMNADGSAQHNLTNHSTSDTLPAWSPDGAKIAFTSQRDGNAEIYLMNADGTSPKRLVGSPVSDTLPAWSPDGTRLAFTSDRDGNFEIYVMNADGSGQTRLTDDPAADVLPDWQPLGRPPMPALPGLPPGPFIPPPGPPPRLSISDAAGLEGDVFRFFVTLSAPSSAPVAVSFLTSDGTPEATAPFANTIADLDYTPRSGLLVFNPGETVKTIEVPVRDDGIAETNEVFVVVLFVPTSAIIEKEVGAGRIINSRLEDEPPHVITEFSNGFVGHPAATTLGPDGNFWSTMQFDQRVSVFDPRTLTATEIPIPEMTFPHGITTGPDGNIWFAGLGDAVGRINVATREVTVFRNGITPNSTPHVIITGPDGNLYFSESAGGIPSPTDPFHPAGDGNGRIGQIDPATGTITEFSAGLPTENYLHGLTVDAEGNIWAALQGRDQLARFNLATKTFDRFASFSPGSGPIDVAHGPDGNIYATLQFANKLGQFNPQTNQVREFSTSLARLDGPSVDQLIVGPDNQSIFFNEFLNDRIGRFDIATQEITEFNSGITPNSAPLGLVIGPDGNVWFSETVLDLTRPGRIARLEVGNKLRIELEVSGSPFSAPVTTWSGDTFWVNAYVEDLRPNGSGVVGGAIDILFDSLKLNPTGNVEYGSEFSLFRQGVADDATGTVEETGALTGTEGVGVGTRAAFVAWQFRADNAPGAVQFIPHPGEGTATITPAEFALVGQPYALSWELVEFVAAEVTLRSTGDFNGDGIRNQFDLAMFIPRLFIPETDPNYETEFDLTGDGPVNQFDLATLVGLLFQDPGLAAANVAPTASFTAILDPAETVLDLEPTAALVADSEPQSPLALRINGTPTTPAAEALTQLAGNDVLWDRGLSILLADEDLSAPRRTADDFLESGIDADPYSLWWRD